MRGEWGGGAHRGERRKASEGKQSARLRSPAPLSILPHCCALSPILLAALAAASGQPASQSVSLSHTIRVSPLCVRRNASLVRVEARTEGKAVCCAVRACAFLAFRLMFSLLLTVGKASRWIRVNAVRLTLIRRRFGLSERHSSLFDAKPRHAPTSRFIVKNSRSLLVVCTLLRAHPDRKWIFPASCGINSLDTLRRTIALIERPVRRSGFRFVRPSLENFYLLWYVDDILHDVYRCITYARVVTS